MRATLIAVGVSWMVTGALAVAQPEPTSVHQRALELHRNTPTSSQLIGSPELRGVQQPLAMRATGPCRTIFGYLPYWEDSSNIQWDALTHLAAFSVEVNANGTLGNDHGWPWTAVVNTAHANGVKVVLVATLFNTGDLQTLVTTPAYKQAFFVNIKNKMLEGTADGINIDFEGTGDWRLHINSFMSELTAYMHSEVPGSEVTFAGPAVNWGNVWDLQGLAASCDGIFVMGYAFAGSWSSTSGPNSPLVGGSINITDTVLDEYGAVTVAMPEKLILGLPYYGGHWTTTTSSPRAPVVAWQGSTRFYNDEPDAQFYGRQWDAVSQTPWYRWHDGTDWHQIWYDDAESLTLKYDLAEDNGLQGVGMWALNYDRERPELWDALRAYGVDPCCSQDVDTTGLSDPDCNSNGIVDVCETMTGGDYTADNIIDLSDYAWFVDCNSSPGDTPTPNSPSCAARCLETFDANADGDVDLEDYAAFGLNMTGQ